MFPQYTCTFLVAQRIKRLPAIRETRVRFLGQEDPLEKEIAIHSSTLAWKIPWTEEPDRLQSMGSQRVGHDWATSHFTLLSEASFIYITSMYVCIRHKWYIRPHRQNILRTNFIKKKFTCIKWPLIYILHLSSDHISERSVSYWHMIYLASIWKIHQQFLPKEPRQWRIF